MVDREVYKTRLGHIMLCLDDGEILDIHAHFVRLSFQDNVKTPGSSGCHCKRRYQVLSACDSPRLTMLKRWAVRSGF